MSILGHRVLRKEDSRFLLGAGRLRREQAARERAVGHVRPLARRARAHRRYRRVGGPGAAGRAGLHRRGRRRWAVPAAAAPRPRAADGPAPRRAGRRPLRRRHRRDRRQRGRAPRAPTPPSSCPSTTTRCPPSSRPADAAKDEMLLFPDVGTNVAARAGSPERRRELFDGCEVVVSGTLVSQRHGAVPARAALGRRRGGRRRPRRRPGSRRRRRTRTATGSRDRSASTRRRSASSRRTSAAASAPRCWASRRSSSSGSRAGSGGPVRWTESRSESMVALGHGRGAGGATSRSAGPATARCSPTGSKCSRTPAPTRRIGAFLPHLTHLMASGVYAIPKIEFSSVSVVTNTTPTTPFRGAGRPEATQAIERAIDALRRRDRPRSGRGAPRELHRDGRVPAHDRLGRDLRLAATTRARSTCALAGGRTTTSCAPSSAAPAQDGGATQLGIGVSAYVEITNGLAETEFGDVEITPDGEAILRTGSFSHGQGHETTFAMIVADRLGLPIETVTVVKGDTDEVAKGTGTYGSKSTQIGGMAAALAAETVVEQAQCARRRLPRGERRRRRARRRPRPLPRRRRARAGALLGRARPRAAGRREARPSCRPSTSFQPASRRSRSARTSPWSRSTPRRARVELLPARRRRRRRDADQPARRRGPGARRRRDGRRRRRSSRRFVYDDDGNPLTGHVRGLRVPVRRRAAVVRGGRDGDADAGQRARREGDRRVGDDRLDARRPERGRRRARAVRRPPHRHARERRERLARAARGSVTPPVVALLGLGEAGSRLAADLAAAGAEVRGYDPDGDGRRRPAGRVRRSPSAAVAGARRRAQRQPRTGRARGGDGRAAGAARRSPSTPT